MIRSGRQPDPYVFWGIALGAVLFGMYVYPGFMSPVESHFEGACRQIPLAASAEDLRIDPVTGIAYLSYFDRIQPEDGAPRRTPAQPGTVMLVDLNAADPHPRAALNSEPPGFSPVGLSLYAPATGPKRLFVVSRSTLGKHSIEIFEQTATGAFSPVETLSDRLLWSPNAIVAVGPRQFYVTNDAGFKEKDAADATRFVHNRLRNNRANILYFDGERMKVVAERLDMASGIAMSPDGHTLYVSESTGRRVRLFDRDRTSGELKRRDAVHVDGAPANLTVAADGAVWIGSHPRLMALWENLRDPTSRSPSQALKFTPGAERGKRVTEEYLNGGKALSASTVAAPFRDLLVMGSITDHKLLLCKRASGSTAATPATISGPEKET